MLTYASTVMEGLLPFVDLPMSENAGILADIVVVELNQLAMQPPI